MALKEKIGARSVRLALTVLAGSVLFSGQSMADETIQKVEITGSSIKRIAVEGALPVQRLSLEAIAKTGATTIADLVQNLPAMQGFQIGATAAGSDSGGRTSASIHDIGESYTLVLLNGRRIAPQGADNTVNLNAIPMSAVERVEILTDGASALYGSDAIAGVINFILKKNLQGGNIEATYTAPEHSGGGNSWNTNVTYGFGDLDEDRYNVLVSYRHDEQEKVRATDRTFARSGYIPFSRNGKNYIYNNTSTSTAPANVALSFKDNKPTKGYTYNPYLQANGDCAPQSYVLQTNSNACGFDGASMVEIVPQSKRDSLFTRATYKVSDDMTAFAEVALSHYDLTARIAANPVPLTLFNRDPETGKITQLPAFNKYIESGLTTDQLNGLSSAIANYRLVDWGPRASQSITDTKHLVVGVEGEFAGWNYSSGLTWSKNSINERYVGGYAKRENFTALINDQAFNPFALPGQQTAAIQQMINDSQFNGSVRTASTTLRGVDAHGSREVFSLPGGMANIGIGGDYREYSYEQTPDAGANQNTIYGFESKKAYDLSRKTYGVFAELLAPVTKTVEVTIGARLDNVSAVDNGLTHTTTGKSESASTYKVSARWQPVQSLLIRGSYGTGFKAPSMLDLGQPLVSSGFTATSYDCPFPGTAGCQDSKKQYNRLSGGNPDLKSETSKQFTAGFRVEPNSSFSFGADLWDVKIFDAVSSVAESLAFSNPEKYKDYFMMFTPADSPKAFYAFKSLAMNIGQMHNRGIDWDMTARKKLDFGNLTVNLNGTHMLKADYTVPGTRNDWTTSLNIYGINQAVTFRDLIKLTATLDTGKLSNTVVMNYRNGYTDALTEVYNVDTKGMEKIRLDVPSHITFDWQGRYAINNKTSVRAGIKNLFDRNPPLSLRASSGHQVGFDPRYADPMLRTFYITGSYKF